MEIDSLDDFDSRFQPTFEPTFWNGHAVKCLTGLGPKFHDRIRQDATLFGRAVTTLFPSETTQKPKDVAWAASRKFTDFYLGQHRAPQETLVKAAEYAITGRISLSDLLAPDYLDRMIQVSPFALPADVNLAFFELPEGLSLETILSCPALFQVFVPYCHYENPHFNPFFAAGQFDTYLTWLSGQYAEATAAAQARAVAPTLQLAKSAEAAAMQAQTAATAATQAKDPTTAIEHFQTASTSAEDARTAATRAEQNRAAAEATAQAKADAAVRERGKAIAAEVAKVQAESTPAPCDIKSVILFLGTELKDYESWLNAKKNTAEVAAKQNILAAAADEEARIAASIAAAHTQAAFFAIEQARAAENAAAQATASALASLQLSFLPIVSPIIPEISTLRALHPFYPQMNLEDSLGKEYVSQMVQQFHLSGSSTFFVDARSIALDPLQEQSKIWDTLETIGREKKPEFYDPIPTLPGSTQILKPSFNQQFVQLIEEKLGAVDSPDYLNQFGRFHADNQEFVQLIEEKLTEFDSPEFSDQLKQWHVDNRELVTLVEKRLEEADNLAGTIKNEGIQRSYAAGMQMIENFFKESGSRSPVSLTENYASTLFSTQPTGPFQTVPLLGHADQSTIHFHCGIANNFASIVEGGLCLNESLDDGFAVKSHLIHSDNIAKGLGFVLLEKANEITKNHPFIAGLSPAAFLLPKVVLDHSQIQQGIQYEFETLSKIAQNILEKGNPNLKQVHVVFSNGGYQHKEALKLLPLEYRQTIVVITVGTTAIIENDLACKVYNIIGDKDRPSRICNGGWAGIEAAKKNGADIEMIPQNETESFVGGHYFMQPDYQNRISEIINDKIGIEYEIY